YGQATRPPQEELKEEVWTSNSNFTEPWYLYRFANYLLRPEVSQGPQGGVEMYIGNLGSITINHYTQTVTDLIELMKVDSVEKIYASQPTWVQQYQYRNVAKVRQFGWEGSATM